jgi:hypothetical protein
VSVYERAARGMYVGSMILEFLHNSSYGVLPLYVVAGHGRIGVTKVLEHTDSAPQRSNRRHTMPPYPNTNFDALSLEGEG